jgi:two-component system, NtrC family, sensor kinase
MMISAAGFPWRSTDSRGEESSFWLRRRILAALLLVSSVPFLLLGAGAWFVFRGLAIEQTLGLHRTMARAHAAAIDLYLLEKVHSLEVIARTHSVDELRRPERLREVFDAIEGVHQHGFVDLGVIDHDGRHLAYVGPFDLMDRTYQDAEWFQAVMTRGSMVSDVFLGHRQAPHTVIAVRQPSRDGWWVLRATLDNRSLYALVRSLEVGATGDVFLVNREGLFQTPPRVGAVLAPSAQVNPQFHRDVQDQRVRTGEGIMRQVTTWLNEGQWLLVVQQPEREILAPVSRAVAEGAMVVALALIVVLVATVLVTSRLIRRVEQADQQRDLMYGDLLRSAKLASLGEMATGLAHEINNPLAIISAEQTNLGDELSDLDLPTGARETLEEGIQRCKRQVERCGNITAKMLQFGRKTETVLRATEVEPVLREICQLLDRRARNSNVNLALKVDSGLPPAWLDANELEQVLANLVNNSVDAIDGGGTVTVSATREGDHILLQVADNGKGIPPEQLSRIFQPFFTTKPVGQGTGLGLAVVYGIVQGWGGSTQVESRPGVGTTMSIRIPLASDRKPLSAWHGA